MGGPGSGNHSPRWGRKTAVENCLSIDANRWMREGILRESAHRAGSWQWTYPSGREFSVNYVVTGLDQSRSKLRLFYSWVRTDSTQLQSVDYTVGLTTTEQHFGGVRWWFVCPLVSNGLACNRRSRKLYLPPDGRYFGCRHCYDLTYMSCQESHRFDRLYRHLAGVLGRDFSAVNEAMAQIGKAIGGTS